MTNFTVEGWSMISCEQQARDMLQRMGINDAQKFTAGDLVELANLISERDRLRKAIESALFSLSGYAPPEFNSPAAILENAVAS